MKEKKIKKRKIFNFALSFGIVIFVFLFFSRVDAARLYFEPQEAVAGAEKEFSVVVNIDAEKPVNAIQAAISIPEELVPIDIAEGNSIISFWVEKPNFDESSHLLTFSGIIPGGFQGEKEPLLIVKFKTTKQEGETYLSFDKNKTKVYLHTPEGVEDFLELERLTLPISEGKENIGVPSTDNVPPENFKPEISRDPNIFENRWFLVFATQDKGLGIARYEVCEGSERKCALAESPYLLRNQNLNKNIFVKAVDKAGNERIAVLSSQKPLQWYENYFITGIIMLGIVVAHRMIKNLWSRFTK